MNLIINRWYQEDCTLGRLQFGDFYCFTLELPFKANERNVSCILPGMYAARKHYSDKNGYVVAIDDVQGRSNIQIHVGNFLSQTEGCILVGKSITYLDEDGKPDVTSSRDTMNRLLNELPEVFFVEIR